MLNAIRKSLCFTHPQFLGQKGHLLKLLGIKPNCRLAWRLLPLLEKSLFKIYLYSDSLYINKYIMNLQAVSVYICIYLLKPFWLQPIFPCPLEATLQVITSSLVCWGLWFSSFTWWRWWGPPSVTSTAGGLALSSMLRHRFMEILRFLRPQPIISGGRGKLGW